MLSGRLLARWTVQAGGFHLVLDGQIDETAVLEPLADPIEGTVIIDLERVTFVNSAGVAAWVRLLERLRARRVAVVLSRCSEAMVIQMNMGVDVRKGALISSFFLPYACHQCGHEQSVCLEVGPHMDALRRMDPPMIACPRCPASMEFAELPDRYFSFLEG